MVSVESQAAMDAAKKALAEFMSKNGRHYTIVHEKVAPAVYHETVSRTEHEELITAVDREITQDHYHTSIQPITDSETLEELHHSNLLPVENRTFEHEDHHDLEVRLAAEQAKFRNEVQRVDGERTQTVHANVAAEHVHHHVFEVIQPVVTKHVLEPHVVHTTVQIHEKIHNASKHHTMSALPVVTMAEFKKQGGILIGREERWDSFEGEPRSVGGTLGTPNMSTSAGASSTEHTTAATRTAATPAPADHTAAPAPAAPERRSSIPSEQKPEQKQQTSTTTSTATSNPSDATKSSETSSQTQSAATAARPTSQPAQQANAGRWNLLPMHLSRSAGDATIGHAAVPVPPRTSLPQAHADGRQGSSAGRSVAGSGQEQSKAAGQGQGQQDQARRGS